MVLPNQYPGMNQSKVKVSSNERLEVNQLTLSAGLQQWVNCRTSAPFSQSQSPDELAWKD